MRCEDPNYDAKFSSLKCKSCPGWVHESSKICSSCHQTLKLNDEELSIVEKYKNGTLPKCDPNMTIKEIRSILKKYMKTFHTFHKIFKEPEDVFAFPKIVSQSQEGNHDALSLGLEIRKLKLNHHSAHLPRFHGVIGLLNLQISDAFFALKLLEEAKFYLKKAEEIMKVVHGEDHPYMRECQKLKMEHQFACASLT